MLVLLLPSMALATGTYKLLDLSMSVVTQERLVHINVYWGEEA